MKNKIQYLFQTHFGRIILFSIITIIGGLFSRNGAIGEIIYNPKNYEKFDFFQWFMIIGIAGLLIYAIIMIVYAWIINPLKNKNKKDK